MLIRDAEISGRRTDVRVAAGRVQELGDLTRQPGEEVVDGSGGVLLSGLTDHHVHLFAWAAALRSAACGPPAVRDAHALRRALAAASPDAAGWVRGVGYTESVAGELDAAALDRLHAERPVRLQHRGGSLWMLNTAAIRLLRLERSDDPGIERAADGRPTGRVWRADHLLRPPSASSAVPYPDLTAVAGMLARWGVTAVTDASPDLGEAAVSALTAQMEHRTLPQRVRLLGAPCGAVLRCPRLTPGPWKIVVRDDALPGLAELVATIGSAHARARPVALHCLTVDALALSLAAFDEAGSIPGDRIEHAGVVPDWCLGPLRRHGLRVVTQPAFLADRGEDMVAGTPAGEEDFLYRYAGLRDAGVRVFPSSDAPYGPADPWRVMAAARDRTTESGRVIARAERVGVAVTLNGYLTPGELPLSGPAVLRPGIAADLVLLRGGLREVLAEPDAERVRLTMIDGRVVHQAP
ncbi:amidohydrolase family protein [Nonomuraea bangladeshensis]|uniref:amidohydrolase family protein n=1 Tax=Nonomuraea bangladeshensis TaxID=404385 RepID=UPI003C2E7E18